METTDSVMSPAAWRQHRIARGWHAGTDHHGKRPWFVLRETVNGTEWLERHDGQPVRFADHVAADARAAALNGQR